MKLISEQAEKFSVVQPKDQDDPQFYLEGVFLQANIKNRNGRVYPLDIMEREVARYKQQYVDAKRAFGELGHPCFWDKTKALTENGWKLIKDCQVGELVYSINPENGELQMKKITKVNVNHYTGKVLRFKNRTFDTVVTPYHRFLVQTRTGFKFMTAQEISDNFIGTQVRTYKIPKVCQLPIDRNVEFYNIGAIKEHRIKAYHEDLQMSLYDFAGFLGLWLAEGHCSFGKNNRRQVGISQRKSQNIEIIDNLLSKLPVKWNKYCNKKGTYTWITTDARLAEWLRPLGKCYDKYIPKDVLMSLNEEQAGHLLDMFVLGDGTVYSNTKRGFSTSKRLVEDLTVVSLLANKASRVWEDGYPMDNSKDRVIEESIVDKNKLQPIQAFTILNTSGVYLDHNHMTIEQIDWDDNVYCLTVEDNSTFYAMDNGYGFWTGNCNPSINLERTSHLITDIWQDGEYFNAKAKILDTPYGNIVKAMIKEGCQLGVSSRALGSVVNRNGTDYVQDDFRLVTAGDIVWEPSAQTAFPKGIMEDVEWLYDPEKDEYYKSELTEKQKTQHQMEMFRALLRGIASKSP